MRSKILLKAAAIWQRTIKTILKCIPGTNVFLDDIKITAPNDEEHLRILDLALDRLDKHNIKVNLDKCRFMTAVSHLIGMVYNNQIKTWSMMDNTGSGSGDTSRAVGKRRRIAARIHGQETPLNSYSKTSLFIFVSSIST